MPDDFVQWRHAEVIAGTVGVCQRREIAGKPQDHRGGYHANRREHDDLHQDVAGLQQPDRISVPAVARRTPQLRATAGKACRSPFPNLLRADVSQDGRERSDPAAAANPHIVGDGGSHSDLATAFKVDRADEQILPGPSRRLDVGAGLDSDIVARW